MKNECYGRDRSRKLNLLGEKKLKAEMHTKCFKNFNRDVQRVFSGAAPTKDSYN